MRATRPRAPSTTQTEPAPAATSLGNNPVGTVRTRRRVRASIADTVRESSPPTHTRPPDTASRLTEGSATAASTVPLAGTTAASAL